MAVKAILQQPIGWSDRRLYGAWMAIAFAALVALFFLPDTMICADEPMYVGQARMLARGHLLAQPGDPVPGWGDPGAIVRLLGWPLLLVPASSSLRAMFVVALGMYLGGAAAFARMLVRRGLPAFAVALYLVHPLAWPLSRTLMSDVPTLAMLLGSMDAWENRRVGRSALFAAWAIASRLAAIFYVLGLLGALWRKARDREVAWLAAAAAAAVLGDAFLTRYLQGGHLHSAYFGRELAALRGQRWATHVLLYGAGLVLVPPFPLLCVLLRPKRCDRWLLATLPALVFFVLYSRHDTAAHSWAESFFGGQRLLLPVHVIGAIATSEVWAPWLEGAWGLFAAAFVGPMAAIVQCLALVHLYERYAPAVRALDACAPSSIAYNQGAVRVALSVVRSERAYFVPAGAPLPDADVVVLSDHDPSNRFDPNDPRRKLRGFAWPPELSRASCRQFGEFFVVSLRCAAEPVGGSPCSPDRTP